MNNHHNPRQTAVHERSAVLPYSSNWRLAHPYGEQYDENVAAYYSGNGNGSGAYLREYIILHHLPQVKFIARRIHYGLPCSVQLKDLIGEGTVGLIEAVDSFDPSRNVKLKTYAEHKISGAILESLRRVDHLPKRVRKNARILETARIGYFQVHGKYPDDGELTNMLGRPIDKVRRPMINADCHVSSLNRQPGNDKPSTRSDNANEYQENNVPDVMQMSPFDQVSRKEMLALLRTKMEKLPEIYSRNVKGETCRNVLTMYHYDNMTMREIGEVIGVGESRVSQIRADALSILRNSFEEDGIRSSDGSKYAPAVKWPLNGSGRHKRREVTDPEMLKRAESLPENQRTVFLHYNVDKMTYAQISVKLGRSIWYVQDKYTKSLSRLGIIRQDKTDEEAPECAAAA